MDMSHSTVWAKGGGFLATHKQGNHCFMKNMQFDFSQCNNTSEGNTSLAAS